MTKSWKLESDTSIWDSSFYYTYEVYIKDFSHNSCFPLVLSSWLSLICLLEIFFKKLPLSHIKSCHRGPEQEGGLTNWTKRSNTIRVAGTTPLKTPMFGQITDFRFLRKSINQPYLALETYFHFLGDHSSKTFWSEPWFWRFLGLIMPKKCYFAICSSEDCRYELHF